MISTILATYNSQKFIVRQLDSIIGQTKKVDEVIICDDDSKDDTLAIINEYIIRHNLKNWFVYQNEHNIGFIKTFSRAIQLAQGDLIILCDHDDLWMPNKVEVIADIFNKNRSVMVLATSFVRIDENDNVIPIKKKQGCSNNNLIRRKLRKGELNKMSFRDIAVYNISPGCTCAMNKTIRNEYLKEEHKIPHDWKINLIGALLDGLYYLDYETTKYRIYSGNTIGLGHQINYDKRMKLCEIGLIEKKEMLKLVEEYSMKDSTNYCYMKKITEIFQIRLELMETKKIFKYGFKAFLESLNKSHLYESVILDLFSIACNKLERGK